MKAKSVALLSIMIPLVTVMTIIVRVPIPATQGYFNFGDAMVILSGIIFGPYIGFLAGGIGSSLADIISGYPQYALVTLLAKGGEGAIVGTLFKRLYQHSKTLGYLSGLVGGTFMILTYFVFQLYFFGIGAALIELPWNILQCTIGTAVAYMIHLILKPTLSKILR
ncbi:MAG: ECF transporter S component [Nitrososphaeria archaeon]|nr:ECF transporter S component [Nitrososphaeria archaeon]